MPPSRGRKSRTDPPSKSKAARIKYPPQVWAEELLNVTRRYKAYEDIMRAMRAEFKEGMLRLQYEEQVGSRAEQRHRLESEEHQALMAWNREESHRALRRREERLRREEDAALLQRELASHRREETAREEIQEREEEVSQLQEASRHFITPHNLSDRIDAALDNPQNYNFCLDREGRILRQSGGQA